MDQVGLLLPTGEVEVVAAAMVGKRKAVQVHLRHDQSGNASKDKQASTAESHQALRKEYAHQQARPNGTQPHVLQLLEKVQVRVRISGNMFLDQRHSDV